MLLLYLFGRSLAVYWTKNKTKLVSCYPAFLFDLCSNFVRQNGLPERADILVNSDVFSTFKMRTATIYL